MLEKIFKQTSNENLGTFLIFIQLIAAVLQPVLTKLIVGKINPLFSASIIALIGSIIPLIFLIKKDKLKAIFAKGNIKDILLVGFFGTTLAYIFLFFGAKLTTGINTAILLQTEPIFALILGYLILKEKITIKQILATLLIIIGVIFVAYANGFSLNWGDILIICAPLVWQISHIIAKKSMEKLSIYAIQAGRYLFAGITLLLISSIFNVNQFNLVLVPSNLIIILILGLITAGIGSLAWYGGIKRINLSKATAILSPYPALSLILSLFILKEKPTIFQIVGLAIMLVGVFILAKLKSEKR